MTIPYQLVKSGRRKTIALQIKQGKVLVRAPYHLSDEFVAQFVASKNAWLRSKLDQYSPSQTDNICRFRNGDRLFIGGEVKFLVIDYAEKASVNVAEQTILVHISLRSKNNLNTETELIYKVKSQLERWFRDELQQYIDNRLPELIAYTGLKPTTYKVRKYRARWGSCNNKGQLSFNALLMMVPRWVVDYVIIHELCHLKYLNHSKQFWQLVEKYCPDFLSAKSWLKQYQYQLSWSD